MRNALQTLGSVIAPTTLLTSLLFYFGWARTRAQAEYLGMDESVFGFSTQDYVLRSISAMYLPLAVGLIVALLWLLAHGLLHGSIHASGLAGGRRRRLQLLVGVVAGTGLVSFAFGLYGAFLRSSSLELFTPLSFGIGIALLGYAAHVFGRFLAPSRWTGTSVPDLRWLPPLKATLVALLLSVSLFWAVSDYAVAVGRGRTEQLVANLASRPGVVLYSSERLHLGGTGVIETRLDETESAFRFRHTGLKLLLRANDKYFLLPATWSFSDGITIVIPDTDAVRVEFVRS